MAITLFTQKGKWNSYRFRNIIFDGVFNSSIFSIFAKHTIYTEYEHVFLSYSSLFSFN